jgi:hypothetical protein
MLTATQCTRKYGDPTNIQFERTWMASWDIPADINAGIPQLPNRLYCNKDIIPALEKAFRNLITRGISKEVKTWDGCFNIRKKRGLKTLSLHSWGVAIDINAAWNGLGKTPTLSEAFVKCFTDVGFDWGGTWVRKDGMHFQLANI